MKTGVPQNSVRNQRDAGFHCDAKGSSHPTVYSITSIAVLRVNIAAKLGKGLAVLRWTPRPLIISRVSCIASRVTSL